MYLIKAFSLIDICADHYLLHLSISAKISSETLRNILYALKQQKKNEITEQQLIRLANTNGVDFEALKHTLSSTLRLIKPLLPRKFQQIYIQADDELVSTLLRETLQTHYTVGDYSTINQNQPAPSLLIYFRQNYSDPDLNLIQQTLPDQIYLITCGVIHDQLILDNLYFNRSGLPSHADHLAQLLAEQDTQLAFYRKLIDRNIHELPLLPLNSCQRGYIAHAIHQFVTRLTHFDDRPAAFDTLNWRWRIDLSSFDIQKEIAKSMGPDLVDIDSEVYDDILSTHAKQALAIIPFGNLCLTHATETIINKVIADETKVATSENPHTLSCHATTNSPLSARKPSLRSFANKKMDLATIQSMLVQSFSPNYLGHRPYPSAGGIYSIEPVVFLFNERIAHHQPIISGCYHFRPLQNTLELVKALDLSIAIQQFYHGMITQDTSPNLCILYLAHVGKSIFKYRYRGYRHVLMEVGSMYQQIAMVAQDLGLRSSVWSSFNDHQVMYELGLDNRTFLPLTMQFVGYEE